MHSHYHLFIIWLHQHAQWGGVAAFVIAFAESVAIVGSIVPGSVTMTAVGVLIGSGVLPIWTTLIWAISGAFFGDGISYLLGFHFKDKIRCCWPFSRYPKILSTGEVFFFKHGGKSIFIGRFVGPVRAIVPIIAGMLKMSPKRYFPISFLTAVCWAPIYMLPGMVLGTVSLTMPADIAAELIVFVLLLLFFIWLVFWIVKILYQKTHNYFEIILDRKWQQWLQQPSKRWICNLLRRADHPYSRGQLFLAGVMLLFGISFLLFAFAVVLHAPLVHWVYSLYYLLRGLRTEELDKIAIVIMSFGYYWILAIIAAVLICWLALRKRWLAFMHWLLACALVAILVIMFQYLYILPRPPGLLNPPVVVLSFPSLSITSTVVFYILFAFMFTRNMHKELRKYIYGAALTICIAVALSRMYLGLNWLTDVVAGICLGGAIVSFVIISYRRYKPVKISVVDIFFVVLVAFAITNTWYLYKNFNANLHNFQRYWPVYTISEHKWWSQSVPIIPLYRTDRFGHPTQLLNLQWAGSLEDIKATLAAQGWQDFHVGGYVDLVKHLLQQTDFAKRRPLLADLYQHRPPMMSAINYSVAGKFPVVMRLWKTNIVLTPGNIPLWVGVVGYYIVSKHFLFFHKSRMVLATEKDQAGVFQLLAHYMWRAKVVDCKGLPKELSKQCALFKFLLIGRRLR
ncbi:MAG: VTT domain-containing protein [Gammaproteobacteria bacterium]